MLSKVSCWHETIISTPAAAKLPALLAHFWKINVPRILRQVITKNNLFRQGKRIMIYSPTQILKIIQKWCIVPNMSRKQAHIPHFFYKMPRPALLAWKHKSSGKFGIHPLGERKSGWISQLSHLSHVKIEGDKTVAAKRNLIVIHKIDFTAKNLTSNAGIYLLLENAKTNGIFELIDNDLMFGKESTNKIKMNHN